MRYLFSVLLASMSTFSLAQKDSVKLSGIFERLPVIKLVVFQYELAGVKVQDTIPVHNNSFDYKRPLSGPVVANMILRSDEPLRYWRSVPVTSYNFNLILVPEKVKLVFTDSVQNRRYTGGPALADYELLEKDIRPIRDAEQRLGLKFAEALSSKDTILSKQLLGVSDSLSRRRRAVYRNFLQGHMNSPIALFVLNLYAGHESDLDTYSTLFGKLPKKQRESPAGKAFARNMARNKVTSIGKIAPSFSVPDTLGKMVSLHSFRGKYVLVDFWASWCGPCRKENPFVVAAYSKYRHRNFTVLGISLDDEAGRGKWLEAIHKDGLLWTQVSERKGWESAVVKLYGIEGIPQNFLLDPSGKIIAKSLRGDDLEAKLAEVLKP